jgi:meiotically up-regulated gene 157 (Mug157) protein
MIKRFLPYVSVALLVIACNGFGGPKKPSNLISKKDMANILMDARLIGSATHINKQKMQKHGIKLDSYVFEKYGIDSLQFALSNAYYAYHIKDYEEIYNIMTDSLEKLKKVLNEQKLKEEKEQERRKKDSINALKVKDSLDVTIKKDSLAKKDSLTEDLLKKKIKEDAGVLINPVSDKNHQSQK